jgi:hypothetical protein
MKIVSPCREQARRVYYGIVFETKKTPICTESAGCEVKLEFPAPYESRGKGHGEIKKTSG